MGKEKIRKVFLEVLPRKEGIGALKGKQVIDWKNSVGHKVKFIYDDIEGEVEILSYNTETRHLIIKYLNEEFKILSTQLAECGLTKVLKLRTSEFKYEIGYTFKDGKRDLTIIDKKYSKANNGQIIKIYKYKCNICGFDGDEHYKNGELQKEHWILESSLKCGIGCACCANQIAVLGINTILDTDRWMVDLGVSVEDAKTHTKSSNDEIEVTCPDCNTKRKMKISVVHNNKSIFCICKDGARYPEKFVFNILKQLNINFQKEYSPNWVETKRYDFYLPDYNTIIETHGIQHYEEKNWRRKGGKTLKEIQENDRLKYELALNNEIEHYIVIDCRYSKFEWIKENILNSELDNLLDLSKIDWLEAEEFATKSLIKEVCEYWNNKEDWETTQTIADNNTWGIKSAPTIRKYLVIGNNLGICKYDKNLEIKKASIKPLTACKKRTQIFKNGILLDSFMSAKELEEKSEELFGVKLYNSGISYAIKNDRHYKGFTFKYI